MQGNDEYKFYTCPISSSITNLFTDDDATPDNETEAFQDGSEEFLPYFPPSQRISRFGAFEFEGSFPTQVEGCNCRTGETCRWIKPSPYPRLPYGEATYQGLDILRLRLFETWELRNHQASAARIEIRTKGGSGTTDLWRHPDWKLRIDAVQIGCCCRNDSIWLLTDCSGEGNAWIFLIKPREDQKVSIVLYRNKAERIVSSSLRTTSRLRPDGRAISYSRVVEYEFTFQAQVQAMSTISIRTSQLWKDVFDSSFIEILSNIPYPEWGGFLRLFRK